MIHKYQMALSPHHLNIAK